MTNNFKQYRNKENGEMVEAKLEGGRYLITSLSGSNESYGLEKKVFQMLFEKPSFPLYRRKDNHRIIVEREDEILSDMKIFTLIDSYMLGSQLGRTEEIRNREADKVANLVRPLQQMQKFKEQYELIENDNDK
jgi:hypothetical protein